MIRDGTEQRLVYELHTEDLPRLLVGREQNNPVRAVITSMRAGGVSRQRVWHPMRRRGSSRRTEDTSRRGGRIKPYEEGAAPDGSARAAPPPRSSERRLP